VIHSTARPEATHPRDAEEADIDPLANLWHEGWLDAHAEIVPAQLRRLRTLASFTDRLRKALPTVRVVGPPGEPVGFHIVKGAELYQLYVSRTARGSGVAASLSADAEARLAGNGAETAWLACAIGNDRAARFYEKCGWTRTGTMINELETTEGTFSLETWRYEKPLKAKAIAR
jgi:ribosomal protein S18 acetylase RimI-like enzyme